MTMLRALPPNGGGAETPGNVAKSGRTRFSAASCISPTVRLVLEKTRFPTGTLPASNRITNGGTVPGGMKARAVHVSDRFGHRLRHVRPRMKLKFNDRGALDGFRFDMLYA